MTTASEEPGFRVQDLLDSVRNDDLRELVGSTAYALLEKLEPDRVRGVERASTLARLVSLERVLEDQKKRSILLHALPAQKLAELENRMNTSLTTVDKMSAIDGKIRNTILGFFGQSRSTEPSEVFLTADPTIRTQRGLFPHQKQVASDVERYLYRETGRAMLHLPTGVGKTRTAMSVVATHLRNGHNRLVVWLANNSEILEQAAAEFEQTWHAVGDRDVTCHRFWGNRDAPDSGMRDGIIVAGLAKLHSLGKTSERLERLGDCTTFVVFDEAHQALAPTYRRVTEILSRRNPRTPLLGLSATPGRTWNDPGEDIELSELFHHNKVTLDFGEENPVTHLTEHGYLSKATFRTINFAAGAHSRTSFVDGDTVDGEYSEGTLTALGDDDDRNLQILACIRSLAEHHSRILVFAPSVRAAELISSVAGASGLQADCITGVTESARRQRAISRFKRSGRRAQVLVNYGVLTTGFDAPKASAAVIARPTMSLVLYSQMVGRVIRGPLAGGTESCEIVTVADTSLPGFGNIAEAFLNWEDVWQHNNNSN